MRTLWYDAVWLGFSGFAAVEMARRHGYPEGVLVAVLCGILYVAGHARRVATAR